MFNLEDKMSFPKMPKFDDMPKRRINWTSVAAVALPVLTSVLLYTVVKTKGAEIDRLKSENAALVYELTETAPASLLSEREYQLDTVSSNLAESVMANGELDNKIDELEREVERLYSKNNLLSQRINSLIKEKDHYYNQLIK